MNRLKTCSTYRIVSPTGVQTATVFQRNTSVIAEDEAWVTLTALHTHVLTARRAGRTQTSFRTGAHTQGV